MSNLFDDLSDLTPVQVQALLDPKRIRKLPFRYSHPVTDQFPVMPSEEYAALVRDIRLRGQQRPILMFEGKIWDGRSRYAACIQVGLVPRVWAIRRGDPIMYLLRDHRHRYGLPQTPERTAALKLLEQIEEKSWKEQAAKEKKEWIAEHRREFDRPWRRAERCAVCSLDAAYSHGHHSIPLALQYDLGVDVCSHEHDWLCPVHHKTIHQLINVRLLGTARGAPYLSNPTHAANLKKLFTKVAKIYDDLGGEPRMHWRNR